jgi:hypothetical protein
VTTVAADRAPNIVLIVADDMGWGEFGFNCRTEWTTPTLDALLEMPLFLKAGGHVPVALESTYQSAWEAVPRRWRSVIDGWPEPHAGLLGAGRIG